MPVQPIDIRRAYRFALGYLNSDMLALQSVLDEVDSGPQPQTMRALLIGLVELAITVLIDGARGDEAIARLALERGLAATISASIERGEDVSDSAERHDERGEPND